MRKYELAEHTADIRLQLQADSLQDLFAVAVEGMAELIKPDSCKQQPSRRSSELWRTQQTETISIETSAGDVTTLLIDFLSEVLTQIHIKKVVYCSVTFSKLDETSRKNI